MFYHFDVADPAKRGVETKPTTPNIGKGFNQACQIDDIVSVNGKPAKGLHMTCPWRMGFNPDPAPGFGVADSAAAGPHIGCYWELLSKDGKFAGRFVDGGFFPQSVFGGAGAFFGASGEHHFVSVRPERAASVAKDPSLRRAFGGGSYRVQYYFVPMFYPQIDAGPEGSAVFHADDFSPVTAARPARGRIAGSPGEESRPNDAAGPSRPAISEVAGEFAAGSQLRCRGDDPGTVSEAYTWRGRSCLPQRH